MKRIFVIAFTLIMVIAALAGCMSPQTSSGRGEGQNPPQILDPPVPGEVIGLKINSLDKLNYFAALRTITGAAAISKQSQTCGNLGILLLANGADKEETPPTPDTTGPDGAGEPPVTPEDGDTTDPDEEIYYYELDPNEPFVVSKVSMFQIELTDENGFLASKLGLGIVDVVINENCIWGESLLTFRNGEKFFSCLTNGWSLNEKTGGCLWDFSTHKYVEGFNIVKNFEQENYAFYIDMDAEGQAFAFACREAQNGGYRADQNIKVVSATSISDQKGSFTISELEDYFNNDCVL